MERNKKTTPPRSPARVLPDERKPTSCKSGIRQFHPNGIPILGSPALFGRVATLLRFRDGWLDSRISNYAPAIISPGRKVNVIPPSSPGYLEYNASLRCEPRRRCCHAGYDKSECASQAVVPSEFETELRMTYDIGPCWSSASAYAYSPSATHSPFSSLAGLCLGERVRSTMLTHR